MILQGSFSRLAVPGGGNVPSPPEGFERAIDLIRDKLNGWLEAVIAKLPNLVVAVVVVALAWLFARLLRQVLEKGLRQTGLTPPLRHLVTSFFAVVVVAAGFFIGLGVLGLDKTVTSLLAGIGIVGLAVGFAFQDIAANFMAGVFLSVRRPFQIGDLIETNDFFGTVEEINLRNTLLRRPEGQVVRIPNREVFEKPVTNYTETGERRVDLPVGVSYGDDLETARRVALEAVESVPGRRQDRAVELYFEEFGSSSINLVLRFWISDTRQGSYLEARSAAIRAVKAAFDAHGITIPFPIRTLDFGIVGGEKLSDMLAPRETGGEAGEP